MFRAYLKLFHLGLHQNILADLFVVVRQMCIAYLTCSSGSKRVRLAVHRGQKLLIFGKLAIFVIQWL